MFIKNNTNKSKNKEKTENLNIEKMFFSVLAICLMIIIIINTIQLFNLIDSIKEINDTLKTLSTISQNYELQKELKTSYIIQLIKSICILIAEISGIILCGSFATKVPNNNDEQKENK